MKRTLLFLLATALLLPLLLSSCARRVTLSMFCLDTLVEVSVTTHSGKDGVETLLRDSLEYYESVFSPTNKESELYRINRSPDTVFTVSADMAAVIGRSLEYARMSGGALDFTCGALIEVWDISDRDKPLPTEEEIETALANVGYGGVTLDGTTLSRKAGIVMDFGAIAKGYIAERLCERLLELDSEMNGILSLGGNVSCIGGKKGGEPFKIGVTNPRRLGGTDAGIVGYVMTDSGHVSVCGTYERYKEIDGKRYHHVLDTVSGYPADNGIDCVLVLSSDGVAADALSTLFFLVGEARASELTSSGEISASAIFFYSDGRTVTLGDIEYITYD